MNFRSRAAESHTIPLVLLCVCLLGLAAAGGLIYTNRNAIVKRFGAVAPLTRTPVASASFPCDLPTVEGERAIAVVDIRGGVLNLTCSSTRPLLKPITPKGGK